MEETSNNELIISYYAIFDVFIVSTLLLPIITIITDYYMLPTGQLAHVNYPSLPEPGPESLI